MQTMGLPSLILILAVLPHFNSISSVLGEGNQFQILTNRYFPGQPVQCCSQVGSALNNGGSEAWLELCKALKIVGDYRLSTPANITRWAVQASSSGELSEKDFNKTILYQTSTTGCPVYMAQTEGFPSTITNGSSGTTGSSCFAMAINLETSNGVDISGLNAEEQVSFILYEFLLHALLVTTIVNLTNYYHLQYHLYGLLGD